MSQQSRNRINVYICAYGHQTVTLDADEGVTPFIIGCDRRNCGLDARSSFYHDSLQDREPTHEWYTPSEAEQRKLDRWTREHVQKGGLILRRIEGKAALQDDQDARHRLLRDPNAPCLCASGKKARKCCER